MRSSRTACLELELLRSLPPIPHQSIDLTFIRRMQSWWCGCSWLLVKKEGNGPDMCVIGKESDDYKKRGRQCEVRVALSYHVDQTSGFIRLARFF